MMLVQAQWLASLPQTLSALCLLGVLLLICLPRAAQAEEEAPLLVEVIDAYLELHTGPGRAFPVFHVVERGEQVTLLKQRTDWVKVETRKGKQGWARVRDLERTLTAAGQGVRFAGGDLAGFDTRRWELGFLSGDFGGANVLSLYGGFHFNPLLSLELSASKVLGNFSDSEMVNLNLVGQPFPEWRLSPFFTLGTGLIHTQPQVTLVQEEDRTDQLGHVGVGVRAYITRRFVARAEYRNFVVFQSTDDNEEISQWQVGISVFF